MASAAERCAVRALQVELGEIQEKPVEGFRVKLIDDNIFHWEVAVFGPPDTLYEGGYFKAHMKFPQDYPYSPPTVQFISKMWHPNVYKNGEVCISILHPPDHDPFSGELPSERWNPTQTVRTILLSIISLLNEPNTFSPVNMEASIMYLNWKQSNGRKKAYKRVIRKYVRQSKEDAARDGVVVPTTLEEYCVRSAPPAGEPQLLEPAFYEDDYFVSTDEETQSEEDQEEEVIHNGTGEDIAYSGSNLKSPLAEETHGGDKDSMEPSGQDDNRIDQATDSLQPDSKEDGVGRLASDKGKVNPALGEDGGPVLQPDDTTDSPPSDEQSDRMTQD